MRNSKSKLLVIALVLLAFVIVGCSNEKKNISENDPFTKGEDDILGSDVENENNGNDDLPKTDDNKDDDNIAPVDNVEVMIYILNIDTGDIESTVSLIPSNKEITAETIVDSVVESMADVSLFIGIDQVTTEGDTVIVSFLPDDPPVTNVGSGIESAILTSIAQSILDNVSDSKKVIFRIQGEAYSTGHIDLDINEVYLESK